MFGSNCVCMVEWLLFVLISSLVVLVWLFVKCVMICLMFGLNCLNVLFVWMMLVGSVCLSVV